MSREHCNPLPTGSYRRAGLPDWWRKRLWRGRPSIPATPVSPGMARTLGLRMIWPVAECTLFVPTGSAREEKAWPAETSTVRSPPPRRVPRGMLQCTLRCDCHSPVWRWEPSLHNVLPSSTNVIRCVRQQPLEVVDALTDRASELFWRVLLNAAGFGHPHDSRGRPLNGFCNPCEHRDRKETRQAAHSHLGLQYEVFNKEQSDALGILSLCVGPRKCGHEFPS
mmetsp:Transcript_80579/g.224204  ORF Transcript_80579/g.224204 Transcript_80579/m.224204 type:complete len:223 (-) Transcript_80579:752-1420(-)